jgi:hypothetical protein
MSACYVFALTSGPAPALRHANHRIEFVEVAGVHAAIERVARRPAISEEALRAQHDIVMKIAASVEAILPVRFGALVDDRELETIVSMRIRPIREALERVAGRVQMSVRVFASDSAAAPLVEPAREPGSGAAYLEQRRQNATGVPTGQVAIISQAMRAFVADERTERGQGRMRWTLYHLVDRSAVPQYERAIEAFASSTVAVSGPWPPFAFVPELWP